MLVFVGIELQAVSKAAMTSSVGVKMIFFMVYSSDILAVAARSSG
jgi:hypothetical protein